MDNKTQERLQQLLCEYQQKLPAKIAVIETLWQVLQLTWDLSKLRTLHRRVHSLCGSSATYGFKLLSQSAQQLEIYLKYLLTNERPFSSVEREEVTRLLIEVKKVAEHPSQ